MFTVYVDTFKTWSPLQANNSIIGFSADKNWKMWLTYIDWSLHKTCKGSSVYGNPTYMYNKK